MNNRQKVLYISIDYDDCGDILFDDHLYSFVVNTNKKRRKRTEHELAVRKQKVQGRIARAKICKEEFLQFLKEKAQGYDAVKLLVGSLRQSINIDENNMYDHHNGSCFKNFASFCEEQKWISFDKFLLADVQNEKEAGTAMQDKMLNIQTNRYDTGYRFNTTKVKIDIVKHQLEYIRKQHPHDEVDYIFIDDDGSNKYISAIKPTINCPEINVSLIKWDYHEKVRYGKEININTINLPSTTHPCLHQQKQSTSSTALIMCAMPPVMRPLIISLKDEPNPAPDNALTIEINHAAEMGQELTPARKFI